MEKINEDFCCNCSKLNCDIYTDCDKFDAGGGSEMKVKGHPVDDKFKTIEFYLNNGYIYG